MSVVSRVLPGDVRRDAYGRDLIVLRTERGRRGEAQTMVVVGISVGAGVAEARETWTLAMVSSCPRHGRVRLSLRPECGYYYAPWIGRLPAPQVAS